MLYHQQFLILILSLMTRQTYTVLINGKKQIIQAEPSKPLLWIIRENIGLTGSKYGCGAGVCGACSVLINGQVQRSCVLTIDNLPKNANIQTIESLSQEDSFQPLKQAWEKHQVPQCGWCQSGQLMTASQLIKNNPNLNAETIKKEMTNICRCATYPKIVDAIIDAQTKSD